MNKKGKWEVVSFLIIIIIIVAIPIYLNITKIKFENIFVDTIFSVFLIAIFVYSILTKPTNQKADNFIIDFGREIYVKYKDKYDFVIKDKILNIDKIELKKDKNGKKVSFWERDIIYNYLRYEYSKSIEENSKERNINKNRFLLDSLTENSEGIIKANERDKKKYKKIKILESCLILLFPIMLIVLFLAVLTGGLYDISKIFKIIPVLIIFTIFFSIIKIIKNFKDIKDAIYLVIDCFICDKKITRTKSSTIYKIRIKDKNELYIDDWWNCSSFTYDEEHVKVLIVKLKNGKNYTYLLEDSIFDNQYNRE